MLRFVFLFYIILNPLSPVQAQGSKNMGNPLGLYFGGDGSNIGYYYFNPDSSFIFFKTAYIPNNKAKEFKDRFNDTLIGYGQGRWFIENSFFVIKFQSVEDENMLNGNLQYHVSSKDPFAAVGVPSLKFNTLTILTPLPCLRQAGTSSPLIIKPGR